MMFIQDVVLVWLEGFKAALKFHLTIIFFMSNPTTFIRTFKCFTLNGAIFLGSIFFKDNVLLPLIYIMGEYVNYIDDHQKEELKFYIETSTTLLFTILWLLPMYFISFILNTIWYLEIAEQVYKQQHGGIYSTQVVSVIIRDEIYRFMLMMIVIGQTTLVYYCLPQKSGVPLFMIYTSWLYAFYCFDYKWCLQGWELDKRLRVFEQHWIYMSGFGMPCALVTWYYPMFVGYGVYAMVFPLCMILAIISNPVLHIKTSTVPDSIPIFGPAQWCTLKILKKLLPVPPRKQPSHSS